MHKKTIWGVNRALLSSKTKNSNKGKPSCPSIINNCMISGQDFKMHRHVNLNFGNSRDSKWQKQMTALLTILRFGNQVVEIGGRRRKRKKKDKGK